MQFKSLIQLLDKFKDEQTCIEYYERIRWNGNPVCPHCGSEKPYKTNRGYKCRSKECHKKFTVKVGTIFENSKISFRTWFAAIYLCTSSKKGVSSVQLADQLGVTQKTAWFVLHRVREMLKEKAPQMLGDNAPVETDETYIGGKDKNKHFSKQRSENDKAVTNDGSQYKTKSVVLGLVERDGQVALKYVPSASKAEMRKFIETHVPKGATVYSDEYHGYRQLKESYSHESVKHSISIYVTGNAHTNTIESFWAILKRGIYGIYHQVSDKHLERYLNEFAARYNTRAIKSDSRFEQFIGNSEGRLKYDDLIAAL